jgi:carboxypeptidase family protein/Big-like domain-containing protein
MSCLYRVAALAALVASGACHGKSPVAPTSGGTANRAVTSSRIEGPASVAPGAAAQFRFLRSYTDGSQEDITAQATWVSSNSTVLSVDRTGRATGVARGEASLSAVLGSSARSTILVLEDGTFRLTGRVLEGTLPLGNARVAVTRGTGAGLSTLTGVDGTFRFYGVAGEIELRVEAAGYAAESRTLLVTTNATTTDVPMHPLAVPADFSGAWRMTIGVSPACGTLAQDVGGVRAFTAAITQNGPGVSVALTSATLFIPAKLAGRVLDRTLTVDFPSEADYYYRGNPTFAVLDRLDATHFLGITGSVRADATGGVARGALAGHLQLYDGSNYFAAKLDRDCNAADHSVTLER